MDSSSIPLWIAFILCVIGGAYFAATESSFSAVNKIKIKSLAEDGNRRAKGVMHVLNRFDKALTTLLVGNNVTKIAGASVATVLATMLFTGEGAFADRGVDINSFAFSIACSAASTAVIFLFSEMIPKSFANDRAQSVSLFFQSSLRFLMKALLPLSAIFGFISSGATRLFAGGAEEPSITEDELVEILDTAEEEGVVDEEQSDILKSALEFDETVVGDVMTMAKDVKALSVTATTEEILQFIRETVHSRVPVCSGSPDNIVGILRIRRFLTEYRKNHKVRLRSLISPTHYVREKDTIDEVLSDMRQHKHHIAIVVDEDKKMVGLVTIEDFLEELVGEIFDEEDVVDRNFQNLGGNKYLVSTNMLMGNAYERMGAGPAPRAIAAKPLLAFMLEMLGHLPREDENFLYENIEVTAKEFENQSVTHAEIHILDEEDLAERRAAAEESEVEA